MMQKHHHWRPRKLPRLSTSLLWLRNHLFRARKSTSNVRRRVVLRLPDPKMFGPGYIVPPVFERSVEPGRCAWRGIFSRYGKRR